VLDVPHEDVRVERLTALFAFGQVEAGSVLDPLEVFKQAFDKVGMTNSTTCHTLRLSFAKHLIVARYDTRSVEELLLGKDMLTWKRMDRRGEYDFEVVAPAPTSDSLPSNVLKVESGATSPLFATNKCSILQNARESVVRRR